MLSSKLILPLALLLSSSHAYTVKQPQAERIRRSQVPLGVASLQHIPDSFERFKTDSSGDQPEVFDWASTQQQQLSTYSNTENDKPFSFDYATFCKEFPLPNNMMIASVKAGLADILAQTVISHPVDGLDWQRTLLFCLFGALYQGGFQYLYQVNIFSKLFDVEKFTNQSWSEKFRDGPGLQSLGIQVVLDLIMLSLVYLPTYYTFKAGLFSDTIDPSVWIANGISTYQSNFGKDQLDLLRVWLPGDLICFSVPLIARLPLRQVISFFFTAYLSSASFGTS